MSKIEEYELTDKGLKLRDLPGDVPGHLLHSKKVSTAKKMSSKEHNQHSPWTKEFSAELHKDGFRKHTSKSGAVSWQKR